MKVFNFKTKVLALTILLTLFSCETVDLNQTENPSTISQSLLDPVYAFNYAQVTLPDFIDSTNSFTQRVIRQMAMTGGNTYDNAFQPANFNNNFSLAYSILNAIKIMEPKAIENKEFHLIGAAKVIRCYVLMTLADVYGDVPMSEALLGNENLSPKYDKSEDVYRQVLLELDDAIAYLLNPNNNSESLAKDLYYPNPKSKITNTSWVTLAKTLKLKMCNNARLAGADIGKNITSEINTIVSGGDYIDRPSEDFEYKYGTSRNTPNTRHPLYNDQYELGGGAYISNYMFWTMTLEKNTLNSNGSYTPTIDPRTDFYFFKQDNLGTIPDSFILPGRSRPEHYNQPSLVSFYEPSVRIPYTVSNWTGGSIPTGGYWGRDHGNNSGIPQDSDKRSVAGMYPIGGAYGSATSVQTGGDKGALGAGIMPFVLSSYVHFMIAESILTSGVSGNAQTEFLAGISDSVDKSTKQINGYPDSVIYNPANIATNKANYISYLTNRFSGASPINQLQIIIKEFFIASWGNGIEPYNNYRRTGFPSNFQPTIEPISGSFYNTCLYSQNSINNNPNTPNKTRTKRVFWDKANLNLN